jgi:radical SAM superfamily enzyme YgiQ (UPF0313 family)
MRKKILLIESGSEQIIYPPIGLMQLASSIRDKYDVIIKDFSGELLNKENIQKEIKKIDPFIIGLRVLTGPGIPRALEISKIAKNLNKIVIWGGPHPTILPEQTLENENVDAVCIGEGEYTLQDIIKYFEGKVKEVNGAGLKIKGKIKIFPPQKRFIDFNNLPMPSWDLIENLNKYFPNKNHNNLPVSTTRGCVFKCGFCHNSNKNVKCYLGSYRIAPAKRAIEELEYVQGLIKNKIDYLDVGEDLHLVSYDYAKQFCEAIKESDIIGWQTSTRYSMLDEKTVELIAKNKCKSIMLGVESGSKRIQEINGKIVELNHAIKIATLLRKKGIFVRNTYIFGHPTETLEELYETIKYIKLIPSDENLIQLYRPMPGTPYFELCLKEGKIKEVPKKLEEWVGFGVLGHDINVSRVPTKILFSEFYKINAIEQSKYWINQQKFFLKNNMIKNFIQNFFKNRFTHKLKEYLSIKK